MGGMSQALALVVNFVPFVLCPLFSCFFLLCHFLPVALALDLVFLPHWPCTYLFAFLFIVDLCAVGMLHISWSMSPPSVCCFLYRTRYYRHGFAPFILRFCRFTGYIERFDAVVHAAHSTRMGL